jgi:hypothetical protein
VEANNDTRTTELEEKMEAKQRERLPEKEQQQKVDQENKEAERADKALITERSQLVEEAEKEKLAENSLGGGHLTSIHSEDMKQVSEKKSSTIEHATGGSSPN